MFFAYIVFITYAFKDQLFWPKMTTEFAAFAWRGPATVALTAVLQTTPAKELEALEAIQLARFVDGQDITDLQTLWSVLTSSEQPPP